MIYLWIKAFHIVAIVAWMAAVLYLPRLFVYHAGVAIDSETSNLFKVMERRLYKAIALPAMLASWVLGLTLVFVTEAWMEGWFHAKFALVILLSGYTGWLGRQVSIFAVDGNVRSSRFFRIANELPTFILVAVVVLVVVKPM